MSNRNFPSAYAVRAAPILTAERLMTAVFIVSLLTTFAACYIAARYRYENAMLRTVVGGYQVGQCMPGPVLPIVAHKYWS